MLELCQIKKYYGKKKVLDGIQMQFAHKIYGLLGINGAGKTTLMQIITGLLLQDEGMVLYHGKDIRKKDSGYFQQLGYMPQQVGLYPDFTAEEFLHYICVLKKIPKKERWERILMLLERVHLLKERKNKIGTFSGGMKQRLGIAAAVMEKPRIVILDEPVNALDESGAEMVRDILAELKENGSVIIIACHDTEELKYLSDEIFTVSEGKITKHEKI